MSARNNDPNTIGRTIAAGLTFVYWDGFLGYSTDLEAGVL